MADTKQVIAMTLIVAGALGIYFGLFKFISLLALIGGVVIGFGIMAAKKQEVANNPTAAKAQEVFGQFKTGLGEGLGALRNAANTMQVDKKLDYMLGKKPQAPVQQPMPQGQPNVIYVQQQPMVDARQAPPPQPQYIYVQPPMQQPMVDARMPQAPQEQKSVESPANRIFNNAMKKGNYWEKQ